MKEFPIDRVLTILQKESVHWDAPVVSLMAARGADPFLILVSVMLSARTRDQVTAKVTADLFTKFKKPQDFVKLTPRQIEPHIRSIGFYKTKARNLKSLSEQLIKRFGGNVPRNIDDLLTLPGVGRKTANLVLGEAFGIAGITVDTHVHRITNRWGYVKTRNPHGTEMALREKLPKKWWIKINPLLVSFGQTTCQPVSPKCSTCPIKKYCPRIGVTKSR